MLDMNKIERYFVTRQALIDQYLKGDMTKKEYLRAAFDAVYYNDFGPFKRIDTVEKGLYNYQYYNALAKHNKSISTEKDLDPELKNDYLEKSQSNYRSKDYATLKVLELLEYRDVSAYHVQVRSKVLKDRLVEIILPEYSMVLHTTNPMILSRLREEGVFVENKRKSVIDGYINQKY